MNDSLYGGSGSDSFLFGGSGKDMLVGAPGGDTSFYGGLGDDRISGGSGDDTFVVETSADVVRDGSGRGVDLVRAKVDFILPDGLANVLVEDLRMQGGFGNIDSTGGSLDNYIQGNSGDNRLAGNQGADKVEGCDGDDLGSQSQGVVSCLPGRL